MNLHDIINTVRRRWLTVLLVTLSVTLGVLVATLSITPLYSSTTRLFFAVQNSESPTDLAQGTTFAEKQMKSYAQVATSPLVLDEVVEGLDLNVSTNELAESVDASAPVDTVILDITVENRSPELATSIANAIARRLAQVTGTLSPQRSDGTDSVKATVLTPATIPTEPSSPNLTLNLALAVFSGLLIGSLIATLRQLLDTKIRSDRDVREASQAPILGTIGFDDRVAAQPVIIADSPQSTASEAIRRLRTNLQFIGNNTGSKTLVVTSSIPGEGKTTTSINLAASIADTGARVLLVDADLRRPSVAEYTGLEGRAGLTSILIGRAEVRDVVQAWRDTSLSVLSSGPVPPNPSELLGSKAMAELLSEVSALYDVVILDTPPLLPVTDATILAKMVGGAVIVVGADRLHRGQLQEALNTLETAGAHVHGLVVNKIAKREANSQTYGYGDAYTYASASQDRAVMDPAVASPVPASSGVKISSREPGARDDNWKWE